MSKWRLKVIFCHICHGQNMVWFMVIHLVLGMVIKCHNAYINPYSWIDDQLQICLSQLIS